MDERIWKGDTVRELRVEFGNFFRWIYCVVMEG